MRPKVFPSASCAIVDLRPQLLKLQSMQAIVLSYHHQQDRVTFHHAMRGRPTKRVPAQINLLNLTEVLKYSDHSFDRDVCSKLSLHRKTNPRAERPGVYVFVPRKRRHCVSKKNWSFFNEKFPAEKAYRLLESILATKYSGHELFIERISYTERILGYSVTQS